MTHQADHSTLDSALKLISANGLGSLAGTLRLLDNESMKLYRVEFLRAGPHKRSGERPSYSNGGAPCSLIRLTRSMLLPSPCHN